MTLPVQPQPFMNVWSQEGGPSTLFVRARARYEQSRSKVCTYINEYIYIYMCVYI